MTIQQPTENRPRPNNTAPPAREDLEFAHDCPDCQRCRADGFARGRTRGWIDAWQAFTGHRIPGADPIPEPELIGWRDVLGKIGSLIRRKP